MVRGMSPRSGSTFGGPLSSPAASGVGRGLAALLEVPAASDDKFVYEEKQKQKFLIGGTPSYLNRHGTGIFITMNPGYEGRRELPNSVKALFRPMIMARPDLQLIGENLLLAQGLEQSRNLARKIIGVYRMAEQACSQAAHYDWGLRALKMLVILTGKSYREWVCGLDNALPTDHMVQTQERLTVEALAKCHVPLLLDDDLPVFISIVIDAFRHTPGSKPLQRGMTTGALASVLPNEKSISSAATPTSPFGKAKEAARANGGSSPPFASSALEIELQSSEEMNISMQAPGSRADLDGRAAVTFEDSAKSGRFEAEMEAAKMRQSGRVHGNRNYQAELQAAKDRQRSRRQSFESFNIRASGDSDLLGSMDAAKTELGSSWSVEAVLQPLLWARESIQLQHVRTAAGELGLIPKVEFLRKVLQLQHLLSSRNSVIIIGEPQSGKSSLWQTLAVSGRRRGRLSGGMMGSASASWEREQVPQVVQTSLMYPNCLGLDEIYGHVDKFSQVLY
jgi:hypothetical protein